MLKSTLNEISFIKNNNKKGRGKLKYPGAARQTIIAERIKII